MSSLPPASDDWLNDELRNVAVPEGMLERLGQIAEFSDEEIDARLTAVPLPGSLLQRLERIATLPPRPRVRQFAVAASLFIALGLSYFTLIAGWLKSTYRPGPTAQRARLNTLLPPSAVEFTADRRPPLLATRLSTLENAASNDFLQAARTVPNIELLPLADVPAAARSVTPFDPLGIGGEVSSGELLKSGDRFGATILAAMRGEDDLPELHKLPGLVPRGIDPPRSPGFDLAFLIHTRFHPVVVPALARELAQSHVPLGVGPESYALARRYLADGELPPAEIVRTEEFLAGMDYGFPSPGRRKLALHLAAGPSPLGGPALRMLQVGVQAGDLEAKKRQPAHLVVAVDVSRSMQRGGRLPSVQAALTEFAHRLGKDDRLSIVTFSEQARLLIEDAGPSDVDQLAAAAASLAPLSGTNVAAGLQMAYDVASDWSWDDQRRRQVVLLSDGLAELDRATAERIEAGLSAAADNQTRLAVIDLSQDQDPDMRLARFAKAGGGLMSRAATADEVRWSLLETLTGQPQLVAADVALTVTFNPKSVLGYRLFGHEATLLAAQPQADLKAGQSGIGLYELQLKPKGEELVATAKLAWRDPLTGQRRSLTKKINRSQFAPNFVGEPASLQLATLAAETAELLRRSPFRENNAYGPLRDLAAEATSEARESSGYAELVAIIQQAPRARAANPRRAWNRLPPRQP